MSKKQPKVFIVGGGQMYVSMFEAEKWKVVPSLKEASLVQFTGGSDVSPDFYNERRHPETYSDAKRDIEERDIFDTALHKQLPMAGICRGGQFLNVMCGGTLYQHVDGHDGSPHMAFDILSEQEVRVTSTHHQMMDPHAVKAKVLMVAWESTAKERMRGGTLTQVTSSHYYPDVEAVAYPDQKVVCFQPHPEYREATKECRERYFHYLSLYCK